MDLAMFLTAIWRGRWFVAATVACSLAFSAVYLILAPSWYRAEVLLAPVEDNQGNKLTGQLGGLANLAGLSTDSNKAVESAAVLGSRKFAREFIEDMNLLPVFWAEIWDSGTQNWTVTDPAEIPDTRDGVRYFEENIRRVNEDAQTGLVRLSIEWKNPDLAATWANALVWRLNASMRDRSLIETEKNVEFLKSQLERNDVLPMQQSISRLLEAEMQKLMLARGNQEFSYRVLDPAYPAKEPVRPRPWLVLLISIIVGFVFGASAILIWIRTLGSHPKSMIDNR